MTPFSKYKILNLEGSTSTRGTPVGGGLGGFPKVVLKNLQPLGNFCCKHKWRQLSTMQHLRDEMHDHAQTQNIYSHSYRAKTRQVFHKWKKLTMHTLSPYN